MENREIILGNRELHSIFGNNSDAPLPLVAKMRKRAQRRNQHARIKLVFRLH